jgi:hypothetical protein
VDISPLLARREIFISVDFQFPQCFFFKKEKIISVLPSIYAACGALQKKTGKF